MLYGSSTRPARQPRPLQLLLVAVMALSAAAVQLPSETAAAAGSKPPSRSDKRLPRPDNRPNVVLITTDDQTLADLRHMPLTRRFIGSKGVTFDGLSPHPLCCPARAEILTGQFAQNNGVRSNLGRYGGYRQLNTRHTIATWMKRSGYHTAFMGKFLNGYGSWSDHGAAPGWDEWNPTVRGVYKFHNYTVRHNRRLRRYNTYQTDFFTNLAVRKIKAASKMRRPLFLWQSYMAPHVACPPSKETKRCWVPPLSARRHRGMFKNAVPPSMLSPAFNEEDVHFAEKPFPLNLAESLDDTKTRKILRLHRRRLQSLQAVDEGIARMVAALYRTNQLKNTLIIFTSDNGYLLGEHRHTGKVLPYEPALRVPLLMRGPGLPRGVVRNRVGTIVDLAPTIAAVGRAQPSLTMDGRNLIPIARRNRRSWDTLLIQAGPYRLRDEPNGWFYRGVRTGRYTYAYYLFSDEHELYDRRRDPYQLDNLADDPRYAEVLQALQRRATILGDCAGWRCRRSFSQLPAPLKDIPADDATTQPTEPSTEPSPDPSPEGSAEVTAEDSPTSTATP